MRTSDIVLEIFADWWALFFLLSMATIGLWWWIGLPNEVLAASFFMFALAIVGLLARWKSVAVVGV